MKKAALILLAIIVTSCKVYTVAPDSLENQFKAAPIASDGSFHAKQMQAIAAAYHAKNVTIKNSPSVEIRLVDLKGNKHNFYFNSLQLRNNLWIGDEIGFWRTKVRKMPVDSIATAEIRNGRKANQ